MNIEPQKVNGTIKEYSKKGALNIWQHQVVYLLPLLILLPMVGFLSFFPLYAKNLLLFFVGIFFMFLYMEITFTTTQEKYTPKKYIASFMVAMYSMVNYFKRHIKMITIYLVILFIMDMIFYFSDSKLFPKNINNSVINSQLILQFIMGIVRYSHTNSLGTIICLSYIYREVISDYFVVERMTGLQNESPEELFTDSIKYNQNFFLKAFFFGIIFNIFASYMIGFQVFVFIIFIASMTLHSMDVFNVDTGKKQKQLELEKNDVKNFVPTMTRA